MIDIFAVAIHSRPSLRNWLTSKLLLMRNWTCSPSCGEWFHLALLSTAGQRSIFVSSLVWTRRARLKSLGTRQENKHLLVVRRLCFYGKEYNGILRRFSEETCRVATQSIK